MNFEIASFSSLSGTQPITWQVEYPRKGTTDTAVSEVFVSQKELVAIVPLATVSLRDRVCACAHLSHCSLVSSPRCSLQSFWGTFP